jgi:hypothetical protein
MSLRVLSPAEKDRLLSLLEEQYGLDAGALEDCVLLEDGADIWVATREVIGLPLKALWTDSVGLLLARSREGAAYPTVAALQQFARSKQSALHLTREEAADFIERRPVRVEADEGLHVVFCGGHALDMGDVKDGRLQRVQSPS